MLLWGGGRVFLDCCCCCWETKRTTWSGTIPVNKKTKMYGPARKLFVFEKVQLDWIKHSENPLLGVQFWCGYGLFVNLSQVADGLNHHPLLCRQITPIFSRTPAPPLLQSIRITNEPFGAREGGSGSGDRIPVKFRCSLFMSPITTWWGNRLNNPFVVVCGWENYARPRSAEISICQSKMWHGKCPDLPVSGKSSCDYSGYFLILLC